MSTTLTFRTEIAPPAGVTFRHLRAPDDYAAMNALANAVRVVEGEEWVATVEQFTAFYEHLSNSDPARDVLVAERDGRVVGYGRGQWHEELDGTRVYTAVAFADLDLPEATHRALLSAIHRAIEGRLREVAAEHPPGPKLFQADASETATVRTAMLRELGYEPVRYDFLMVRPDLEDQPDAPLPEGLEIRPVRPEDLRTIWEAEQEAFQDHWGMGLPTEADYQQFLTDPLNDLSLWRVAWDGEQVAGMVRGFINEAGNEQFGRKRGWVENISVRRPWRRRGLARALIAATITALRERGMTEGALGVDTENPTGALRVYESCGFRPVRTHVTYRRPLATGL